MIKTTWVMIIDHLERFCKITITIKNYFAFLRMGTNIKWFLQNGYCHFAKTHYCSEHSGQKKYGSLYGLQWNFRTNSLNLIKINMDPRPVRDIYFAKKTGRSLKIVFSKRVGTYVKKKTKLKCLSIRSEQFL